MRKSIVLIICSLAFVLSCKQVITADQIIDQAIENAGGSLFDKSEIAFQFRDIDYFIKRDGGDFLMQRSFLLDSNDVVDVFSNQGFQRKMNGISVAVPDSMRKKYQASINSVFYFALLPYRLNDASVNKKYLGTTTVLDKSYDVIQVTFDEEGGGEDHEDEFVYWVEVEKSTVDFLAYSYKTDGGGYRFREAYNARIVDGIRFSDYINYSPKNEPKSLLDLMELYKQDSLKELSRIDLYNISVKPI